MPQTSLSPAHTPKREDFRRVVEIYLKGNKAYSLESVNATELSCAKAVRLIATGWASAVCAYVTELLRSRGVLGLNCFRTGCGDRDGIFAVDKKAHCESKGESFSIEVPIAGGSACFSYGFE